MHRPISTTEKKGAWFPRNGLSESTHFHQSKAVSCSSGRSSTHGKPGIRERRGTVTLRQCCPRGCCPQGCWRLPACTVRARSLVAISLIKGSSSSSCVGWRPAPIVWLTDATQVLLQRQCHVAGLPRLTRGPIFQLWITPRPPARRRREKREKSLPLLAAQLQKHTGRRSRSSQVITPQHYPHAASTRRTHPHAGAHSTATSNN